MEFLPGFYIVSIFKLFFLRRNVLMMYFCLTGCDSQGITIIVISARPFVNSLLIEWLTSAVLSFLSWNFLNRFKRNFCAHLAFLEYLLKNNHFKSINGYLVDVHFNFRNKMKVTLLKPISQFKHIYNCSIVSIWMSRGYVLKDMNFKICGRYPMDDHSKHRDISTRITYP